MTERLQPRCIVCGFSEPDRFAVKYVKPNCLIVECPNCSFHFIPPQYRQTIDYQQYKDDATVAAVAAGDVWIKIQRNLLRYRLIKKYAQTGSIFDIGCGFGHFLLAGRQQGYEVAGVETSRANVRFVREQLGIAVEENDFLQVDETRSYDVITAWDVLEHIDRAGSAAGQLFQPASRRPLVGDGAGSCQLFFQTNHQAAVAGSRL
jgi:SAM-dependent methyltransferase